MTKLEELLLEIDSEVARVLLVQLKDEEKSTPALIGQAIKFLQAHKFEVNKFEKPADALGELAAALPPMTSDDEAYGIH